jgi:2,3-bisphosphoglycerate-independent phosphoglycerate mutase
VVTSDHSTPTTRDVRVIHGGDPVPVLFHGSTVRRDAVERFDEVSATAGGMGQIAGSDLMPVVRYLSRRARFFTG